MTFEEIEIGKKVTVSFGITDQDVNMFVDLTQDRNPIHRGNGMVHGMLVASYISMIIGEILPGNGSIWVSHNISFIEPVHRGDYLTYTVIVKDKRSSSNQVRLLVDVTNDKGNVVLMSTCWVKVPSKDENNDTIYTEYEMEFLKKEYANQMFMGEVSTDNYDDWLKLREKREKESNNI